MTHRLPEPGNYGYASISDGRVFHRSDLAAWGSEARWFELADDNPHGILVDGQPGITWGEVLQLGTLTYIGRARAR